MENENVCALEIFNHNSHIPLLSAEKKVFENSLNTSGDIAVLPGQCKGKNWNFYIFRILQKLQHIPLCYQQNENVCVKGKIQIFTTTVASSSFSQKKVFENSLNTSGDMAFLQGQCKGENWNFYIFWVLEKL